MTFLLALIAALAFGLALGGRSVSAQEDDVFLAIRVGSSNSQLTSVGSACAEIQIGEEFPVDVYIDNVSGLRSFEIRVTYDDSVLAMESADFQHFLLSTPPSGQVLPALFESEAPNRYYLGAAEINGTPDSGSGVLARLTMTAVGAGIGDIGISAAPSIFGPQLSDARGAPIGDTNEDGIFDGPVYAAAAAVSESCDNSDVVEPPISDPGDSPGDDGAAGSDSDGDDGASGNDGVVLDLGSGGPGADGNGPLSAGQGVIVLGPRDNPGEEDNTDSEGPQDGDSGPNVDVEADVDGPDGDGSGDNSGDAAVGGPSDNGASLGAIWYVLIAMGVLALATIGLAIKSFSAR